jgi:hypothetical protein
MDQTPLTDNELTTLADVYSPTLVFDSAERTFPVAVEYFIAHCRLVGPIGAVIERPDPESLGDQGTSGYCLDHLNGTARDAGAIAEYERDRSQTPPTVYVHAFENTGTIVLQYWLFYVFNQGTYNSHEGDWEMVQVMVDHATMSPIQVTLSRHHTGGIVPWPELKGPDLNGTHPIVLVARGSHSHYLRSDAFRMAGDFTDGGGEVLTSSDYAMVSIGRTTDGEATPSWPLFQGLWGERSDWTGMMGTDGPPGPMFRENGLMWSGVDWGT